MPYNPSLDVLRVIAVSLVLAKHSAVPLFGGGFFGVDLFFVLSGFLITSLLVQEHTRAGSIDLGAFYVRRLQRLTPALLLMLVACSMVMAVQQELDAKSTSNLVFAGLYLSDYRRAYFGDMAYLSHTWSLAAEEHYYLIWPLLLVALLRVPRARWLPVLGAVYGIALGVRLWSAFTCNFDVAYHAFHNRLSGLFLGSVAAMLVRHPIARPGRLVWIGLGGLCLSSMLFLWGKKGTASIGITIAEWCSLAAVLACAASPRILSWSRLAWLGKYTYGIYLWHYPILEFLQRFHLHWSETVAVAGITSMALAAVSFHTVERMARAHRRSPSRDAADRSFKRWWAARDSNPEPTD